MNQCIYLKRLVRVGILTALIGMVVIFFHSTNSEVEIKGHIFHVSVAKSDEARTRGLGGVSNIKNDEGMLFLFGEAQPRAFWMKDMRFDLDIIWINKSQIVHIEPNVLRESLRTIAPDVPATSVLEVNSGIADKYGFKIGDVITIK